MPGSRILYGFDHSFFEYVFHYLDAQGIEWGTFKREVVKQLRLKFEDLMNFEKLVNLPARVFAEIVKSDEMYINEEIQALRTIG